MAQHTPGPWTVELSMNTWGDYMVLEATNEWGDRDTPPDGMSDDEATKIDEANARLIASSPDLLAALRDMVEFCATNDNFIDGEFPVPEFITQAHAAIAKAEGN